MDSVLQESMQVISKLPHLPAAIGVPWEDIARKLIGKFWLDKLRFVASAVIIGMKLPPEDTWERLSELLSLGRGLPEKSELYGFHKYQNSLEESGVAHDKFQDLIFGVLSAGAERYKSKIWMIPVEEFTWMATGVPPPRNVITRFCFMGNKTEFRQALKQWIG